ncbi:AlkA N-terminal domain-containing protein [Agromyces sp. LHK192]|uniref:AlkA N-terminal domain-containing protein n=1 Tax=Agromyces sp. LHK192 TaxID=2498704 RepID=UPI000FD70604|nr:AlkA N-terminal domain-containing protein [Agromyces sp. LHK192]
MAIASRDPLADPVFARRYRAMQARDARFDGQFITGVHSTGIYCRPSCPAVSPKPGNVTFYLTSAAAHEAGLRACKRCLPDAVPGSPEWDLRDDLAARAMRLIADGVVEREGVPGLAARLGYTPRHLTRVLSAELGAGPLALARAHRAQVARTLLVSTDLPAADIAFASGFGSIRQFNDTVRAVYERSPLELRAAARRSGRPLPTAAAPAADAGTVRLRLPAREPFDAAGVFAWLAARALDGVEIAHGSHYERVVRLPGGPAHLKIDAGDDGASVEIEATLASLADLPPLVARVRRLFDLDADALAIDAALSADPALAGSVDATPGMRLPGAIAPHELLVRALVGQQVSVASARTSLARLTAELGDPVRFSGAGWRLFPTSEAIAVEGERVLRGPASRIRTIVDIARRLSAGDLVVAAEVGREQLTADLLEIPGIGPWTAGYVAMRVTRAPDVLLTSDLALRQGADRLGLPSAARDLAERGARWAPWRSYASMHLWRAAATSR